ncbi:hypothetical protein HG531_011806 [Fusarium graminearum]|nr:hypothetical protein HG531_011806 [Fusarium graminearum]
MANIAQGIPWDQLIEFANNKKAEEKTTGKPAQLSKQQLAAVSMLVEFVKDIEVEDTYVSKLFEYCQRNKIESPQFTTETFNQCISGTNIPRSRVLCTLPSRNQHFPQEGYGYSTGQAIPTFGKAQKAKNFAAMQALNWLQGRGPSSPRGEKRPASVINESHVHTKIRAEEDNNSEGGALTADSPLPNAKGVPVPSQPAGAQRSAMHEEIAKLGDEMDFGVPEYLIRPAEEGSDLWNGRPIFRNDGTIPPEMGVVTGIAGRQQAEDLVVKKTLEWLQEEKRKSFSLRIYALRTALSTSPSASLAERRTYLCATGQIRHPLPILPKHTNINIASCHQLEVLCAQDALLIALGQQYPVVTQPPLDSILQTLLHVNLDDQLGIPTHAAQDAFLRCSR